MPKVYATVTIEYEWPNMDEVVKMDISVEENILRDILKAAFRREGVKADIKDIGLETH